MAIHYKLTIYERTAKGDYHFDKSNWRKINAADYSHTNPLDLVTDEEMIHFEENRDIAFQFSSDDEDHTRLYIDALDYYNYDLCEEDESGNVYISPTSEFTYLYRNGDKSIGTYYPFVPGRYRFYVQYGDHKDYMYLMVDPKAMNWTMLDEMRREVEEQAEMLAHNLIENRAVIGIKYNQEEASLTGKIILLCRHADIISRLMESIKETPRFVVNKRYNLVSSEKAAIVDRETIKYHLRHPEEKQLWMAPNRELSYDVPENVMIIQCIKYLMSTSKKAMHLIHHYLANSVAELEKYYPNVLKKGGVDDFRRDENADRLLRQKLNLEAQRVKIRRIIFSATLFLDQSWVKQIVHKRSYHSLGIQFDPRYRKLYELYQLVKQEKKRPELSIDYTYCWKRTDKVYEFWGFIRTIKALGSDRLGFLPVDGWIYGQDFLNSNYTIPTLTGGTSVTFKHRKNTSSVIRLVYDQELPFQSTNTDFDHPLYTKNRHRRPDARLDCYKDGQYRASFIMDFKYRPAYAIKMANSGNSQDKIFEQLNSYKHFDSLYVDKDMNYQVPRDRYVWTKKNPIPQVWVMFPNTTHELISEEEEGFVKVPYSPTDSLERLERMIQDAFEKCAIFAKHD